MLTALRPGGVLSYAPAASPARVAAPSGTSTMASGAAAGQANRQLFMHLNSVVDPTPDPDARSLQGVTPSATTPNTLTIQPGHIVNSNFSGYGAEYNPHLYDPSGPLFNKAGSPADKNLHQDVAALGLECTRIIFNGNDLQEGGTSKVHQQQYQSLVKTLQMAKQNGTAVNLTWAGGLRMKDGLTGEAKKEAQTTQDTHLAQIADMLQKLHNQGFTNIKSVTLENEPGIPWHNDMPQYARVYKQFANDLQTRGIRNDVQLIGGDLTADNPNNGALLKQISHSLGNTLDGISFHTYWSAGDKSAPQSFFNNVAKWKKEYPARFWDNVNVQEYGTVAKAGALPGDINGTPTEQTPEAAAQQGAFALMASQNGVKTVLKWDAYYGNQPGKGVGNPGQFDMIEQPNAQGDWKTTPSYQMMRLINHAAQPGWSVVAANGTNSDQAVSAFKGPGSGDFATVAVNRTDASRYITLDGLPAGLQFHRTTFNENQSGTLSVAPTMESPASGTLRVLLPAYGAVSFSTLSPSGL